MKSEVARKPRIVEVLWRKGKSEAARKLTGEHFPEGHACRCADASLPVVATRVRGRLSRLSRLTEIRRGGTKWPENFFSQASSARNVRVYIKRVTLPIDQQPLIIILDSHSISIESALHRPRCATHSDTLVAVMHFPVLLLALLGFVALSSASPNANVLPHAPAAPDAPAPPALAPPDAPAPASGPQKQTAPQFNCAWWMVSHNINPHLAHHPRSPTSTLHLGRSSANRMGRSSANRTTPPPPPLS